MVSRKLHVDKSNEVDRDQTSPSEIDYNILKDEEVWNSLKSGSEEAFIFIYSKYVHDLYNYGCQCTSNHSLVEDCIQELFISIKQKQGFGQVKSIKPYLYKALRRDIFRALKKQSRYYLGGPDYQYDKFQIVFAWEEKVINDQLSKERKVVLENAIAKLTTKQREAIVYYFYEGFTYAEIADIMNMVAVKSARKLIYRAIDSLKHSLNEDDPVGLIEMVLLASVASTEALLLT